MLTAIVLCTVMVYIDPSDQFDRQLSDGMLTARRAPADPSILIVEIAPEDIRKFGGPPFSRNGLLQVMDHLVDAGAERVLLDQYIGDSFDPQVDRELAAVMARMGRDRLALNSGATANEWPLEDFTRYASVVDGRLTPDADGWHRRIGIGNPGFGANPAYWLATGKLASGRVPLDLRIDSRGFDRRSAVQLINSHDSLKGRIVIISAGVRVAPTRAMLPGNQPVSRASVLAIGAQSVREGFIENARAGELANRGLFIVSVLLGLACAATTRSGRMMVLLAIPSCAVLAAIAVSIGSRLGAEMLPFRMIGGFLVMANVTLVQRLRILPMMGSFFRGDISPEEVWAWRSFEQSAHPAFLLSFDGRIKRSNPAAAGLQGKDHLQLAQACLQSRGGGESLLELTERDGQSRLYQIEWPVAQAPIVMLRDVTESESEQRNLRKQLYTDELTGRFNRRGLDLALRDAVFGGTPFAVYFLDMNGFKAVNDTYGHDVGDELLVMVAARLAATVRPGDIVARLGGDEFAVVVKGAIDEARAAELADSMVAEIRRSFLLRSVRHKIHVGIAVGYVRSAEAGNDPHELLRLADKAMYRDKMRSKLKIAV